jgi:hypothetical protein
VVEEVPADALGTLVEAGADQHDARGPDQPGPARPAQNARGRLLRVAGAAAGAEQDLDRGRAEAGVDDAAGQRGDTLAAAGRAFRPARSYRKKTPPRSSKVVS